MKKKITQLFTAICSFLLWMPGSNCLYSQSVIRLDFETNTFKSNSDTSFNPYLWNRYTRRGEIGSGCSAPQIHGLTTVELSTDVVRSGSKSGKCKLDVSNGGVAHKAMFRNDFIEEGTLPQLTKQELWFRFSVYLPDTGSLAWASDTLPEAIFQLYKDEISASGKAAGPEMALACENDVFTLDYRYSDLPLHSTPDSINANVKVRNAWTGTMAKGVWVDWVFHMKYSPLTPHGFLEVWKQEGAGGYVKIVDIHSERIGFPSDLRTNLDLGIYKWPWKCPQPDPVKTRLIYFDEFAKGDSSASFEDMTGIPEPYPSFTAGNLAILRYGNGTTSIGSSLTVPVYIDEYTPAGEKIKSIELPNSASGANKRLTAIGNATTEGLTNLSPDGRYLTVVGYDADPGTHLDSLTNKPRVIGLIQADRSINTSTSLPVSIGRVRTAATTDGNDIWVLSNASTNNIFYTTIGSSSGNTIAISYSSRSIQIVDNKLYLATGSTPLRVVKDPVTGQLPTSGTPSITSYTLAAAANQYALFDTDSSIAGPDLLYTASDAAGAVHKYIFNGSAWTPMGSVAVAGVTPNIKSITGSITDSVVTLYAVSIGNSGSTPATPSALFSIVDTSLPGSLSVSPPTVTTLATAAAKTIFKSVTFVPSASLVARPENAPGAAADTAYKVARLYSLQQEELSKPMLHIYPNPAGNSLKLAYTIIRPNTSWRITDLAGRTILQGKAVKGAAITEITLSSLKNGIYLLLLEEPQQKQAVTFIKN